jgi:hypothetical protein
LDRELHSSGWKAEVLGRASLITIKAIEAATEAVKQGEGNGYIIRSLASYGVGVGSGKSGEGSGVIFGSKKTGLKGAPLGDDENKEIGKIDFKLSFDASTICGPVYGEVPKEIGFFRQFFKIWCGRYKEEENELRERLKEKENEHFH